MFGHTALKLHTARAHTHHSHINLRMHVCAHYTHTCICVLSQELLPNLIRESLSPNTDRHSELHLLLLWGVVPAESDLLLRKLRAQNLRPVLMHTVLLPPARRHCIGHLGARVTGSETRPRFLRVLQAKRFLLLGFIDESPRCPFCSLSYSPTPFIASLAAH